VIPVDNSFNNNTALFLICSMSPTARQSIELETYRVSVEDEASEQHALESAFVDLTKDIEALGLTLNVDYSEVFESQTSLLQFITFASYLLPNTLYGILKSNSQIKECVHHVLDGCLGSDETLVQTYLSELAGLDGQAPLVPDLADVIEQYYPLIEQSAIFTDYMRNLHRLVQDERMAIEIDSSTHDKYRLTIREMISRFSQVVNQLDEQPGFDELIKIQNRFILDLISPIHFVDYNYLFTTEPASLPDDLIPGYEKKWYHYQVSNPWCLDYYTVRKLTPSPAQVMAMYAFEYARHVQKGTGPSAIPNAYDRLPSSPAKQAIDALSQES
jgi:hypothetical protein